MKFTLTEEKDELTKVFDMETMEIAEMVLGRVNKNLVRLVEELGVKAVGISGKDGKLLTVNKKYSDGQDIGFVGDITKVDENALQPFTMICGGSPCQDFSIAGRQEGVKWVCQDCGEEYNPLTVHHSKRDCCPKCGSKNIDKTRSSLLVEWLRIIKANKPVWGIYENVKNIVGKRFKDAFDMFIEELHEYGYNTYWKVLNSKDYGIPQNRERLYLIIILKEFDNGKFEFPEPFDNGIRLKDMLEDEVDEKYYVTSDKATALISQLVYEGKIPE